MIRLNFNVCLLKSLGITLTRLWAVLTLPEMKELSLLKHCKKEP